MLRCRMCEVEKPLEEYYARYKQCKQCVRSKAVKYRLEIKREGPKRGVPETKTCRSCSKIKSFESFRLNSGLCIVCEKEKGKQYRRSDYGKQKARQWASENSDRMVELRSQWYQKNKRNEIYRRRMKEDFKFKCTKHVKIEYEWL